MFDIQPDLLSDSPFYKICKFMWQAKNFTILRTLLNIAVERASLESSSFRVSKPHIGVSFCMQTPCREDVMKGQQIKLIHSVSNLDFHEYYINDFIFFHNSSLGLQRNLLNYIESLHLQNNFLSKIST